ncbi:MAG: hypothetical protein KDI88_02310 [Gammaproteobacteria bacterium]|nr:hypothetical protein [Gammaproteobacteria bacterium]
MFTRVKSEDPEVRQRVEKVMLYYLTSVANSVESVTVTIEDVSDRLGVSLRRCSVDGVLVGGDRIAIVETQSDLMLAVTRAMDRCLRTIRRRHGARRYPRSA